MQKKANQSNKILIKDIKYVCRMISKSNSAIVKIIKNQRMGAGLLPAASKEKNLIDSKKKSQDKDISSHHLLKFSLIDKERKNATKNSQKNISRNMISIQDIIFGLFKSLGKERALARDVILRFKDDGHVSVLPKKGCESSHTVLSKFEFLLNNEHERFMQKVKKVKSYKQLQHTKCAKDVNLIDSDLNDILKNTRNFDLSINN